MVLADVETVKATYRCFIRNGAQGEECWKGVASLAKVLYIANECYYISQSPVFIKGTVEKCENVWQR